MWLAVGDGGAPVPVASGVPSPKVRSHFEIWLDASVVPEPSKVADSGACPPGGDAVRDAVGGDGFTVILTMEVSESPFWLVTVRVAVYVPGLG